MKVQAACAQCSALSNITVDETKLDPDKRVDIQWKCQPCGKTNVYSCRKNRDGILEPASPRLRGAASSGSLNGAQMALRSSQSPRSLDQPSGASPAAAFQPTQPHAAPVEEKKSSDQPDAGPGSGGGGGVLAAKPEEETKKNCLKWVGCLAVVAALQTVCLLCLCNEGHDGDGGDGDMEDQEL